MNLLNYLNNNNIKYLVLNSYKTFKQTDEIDILFEEQFFNSSVNILKNEFDVLVDSEVCLYNLKRIVMVKSENVLFRFFSRPSVRSVDRNQWCPLNTIVQDFFWSNFINIEETFFLSDSSLFFYLICKNVFNNRSKGFDKNDVCILNGIIERNANLLFELRQCFECTFYKFTKKLIYLIETRQYNHIYNKYISFKEY